MLPLPLRWCVLAGFGTAFTHLLIALVTILNDSRHHEVSIILYTQTRVFVMKKDKKKKKKKDDWNLKFKNFFFFFRIYLA